MIKFKMKYYDTLSGVANTEHQSYPAYKTGRTETFFAENLIIR